MMRDIPKEFTLTQQDNLPLALVEEPASQLTFQESILTKSRH